MPLTRDHIAVRLLIVRERAKIRAAFMAFLRTMRSAAKMHSIARHLHTKDIPAALNVMEDPLKEFAHQLSRSFVRAGHAEALMQQHRMRKSAPILIAKQPTMFPFIGDEDAAAMMDEAELDFIQNFTDSQREAVRAALKDALERGYSPSKAARAFRDAIGLTDNQYAAVQNYRSMLENGSAEALNRELRDARFDRTVTGAIQRGDVLDAAQIDRMVSRYSDNMVAHRADTIALTESHRAVSAGRFAAIQALTDNYDIDASDITRTWNTTLDGRQRDSHDEMDGQQVTGFDEPYTSGAGNDLMYPGDPAAPPEETVRCRCVETYEVADQEE